MEKIEFVTGSPSPYSNHVRVERTHAGTYRFEGVSNAGSGPPLRFASRHFGDLEKAKVAAATWASGNGVTLVYLPLTS